MKKIDTSIVELEQLAKAGAYFISGWDKSEDEIEAPIGIVEKAIRLPEYNRYFFMSTIPETKVKFCENLLLHEKISVGVKHISIAPSGTSAMFLSILVIKDIYTISNVLLISPTYYANIKTVQTLGMNLFYFQSSLFEEYAIDLVKFEENILKNKIQLIILVDPLFGSGVSIDLPLYRNIIEIADRHNVWVLIDYIYGGMNWGESATIVNKPLVDMVTQSPKVVLVESISKRLFLNGMKNAIIYANPQLVEKIDEMSESFVGSISCTQHEMFNQLYDSQNRKTVLASIDKNIKYLSDTFETVKSSLLGSNSLFSLVDCGYFFLMGIPIDRIGGLVDMKAALSIADKTNIVTIPHSRYLFELPNYYTFRVNLSMEKTSLLKNINILRDAYLN
ncbi:MAG: aminotransferase class I/II-fold pyridoxal phosphate-dependent enzyme [Turicibacter sp.]|nr:aminotransferase class I/II-fold pyridoxal phosphate-dependent enzyme [Turicibacter sp.]